MRCELNRVLISSTAPAIPRIWDFAHELIFHAAAVITGNPSRASSWNTIKESTVNSQDHSQPDPHITQLLLATNDGDAQAKNRLFLLVERELRIIAAKQMRNERPGHSLQVTVLVDDTLLQLLGDNAEVKWESRRHFYRTAAKKMRHLLIDHERKRRAYRRGGGQHQRLAVDLDQIGVTTSSIDLLALDEALTKLATIDERQSEIVELHHFGGCTLDETARILEVSASTVKGEWRFAKAWLHRELSCESE